MNVKKETGLSGVDVVLSVIVITIFLTLIGNLVININANTQKAKKESDATFYAVQEIETLKAQKYISDYDGQGISSEEILKIKKDNEDKKQDEDIIENGKFTGYHKTIYIQDYANEYKMTNPTGTETIKENILKKLTVEITYNFAGKKQSVRLSTYISSN